MLVSPATVADWLGIQGLLVIQIIGIGLIIFAADLAHQATRPRPATWRALYASIGDFLWVGGTFALLALFPTALSVSGNVLVVLVAVVVFILGAWQIWGIVSAHRVPGSSLYRHCILVAVDAPAEAMWQVIGRIGDIKEYMPSLKSSVILDGKPADVGAVRVCENHAGQRWAEECTSFESGRSFDVRFLAEAPDFPFPTKSMRGGWRVDPTENGSEVMVWWELEPRQQLLAPIVLPILAFQVDRDFPKIVGRMAADALGRTRAGNRAQEVGFEHSVAGKFSNPSLQLRPVMC